MDYCDVEKVCWIKCDLHTVIELKISNFLLRILLLSSFSHFLNSCLSFNSSKVFLLLVTRFSTQPSHSNLSLSLSSSWCVFMTSFDFFSSTVVTSPNHYSASPLHQFHIDSCKNWLLLVIFLIPVSFRFLNLASGCYCITVIRFNKTCDCFTVYNVKWSFYLRDCYHVTLILSLRNISLVLPYLLLWLLFIIVRWF